MPGAFPLCYAAVCFQRCSKNVLVTIKETKVQIGSNKPLVCASSERIMQIPSPFGPPIATVNVQTPFLCLQCLR